jgi:hypothetical protein
VCDTIRELQAPADWYDDGPPIETPNAAHPDGVNPETVDIQEWASNQPGFEGLWIDRDQHNGWVSIAFSKDAEDRQADVQAKFPNRAVVVPVTYDSDHLKQVAHRALQELMAAGISNVSGGFYEQYGFIHIDMPFLEQQWLSVLQENFANEPICVEGQDPALKPPEGPQPQSGEGWRLLADQDETGGSYRTGIAFDKASYDALWLAADLKGDMPAVDFESEVVIWFGAVHGSSCPRLRLDDVVVEADSALVHGGITELDQGICTADAIPHAYVVALERSNLPHGPFAIQVGSDTPPPGALDERTVVDVDLSVPGSTAQPSQIHGGTGFH